MAEGLNPQGQLTNPIQSQNMGQQGDKSMEVALATKMQLILDQPMSDIATKLVNRNFEGDFFKLGDTVAIVKPDPKSIRVELGNISGETGTHGRGGATGYESKDARLIPSNVEFAKTILTIDKYAKYAFNISDLTKAEGRWNYESGNLELAAHNLRKAHNLETVTTIVEDATDQADHIRTLGSSAASPIRIQTPDDLYKVVKRMRSKLYSAGAITADGQVTYGSNQSEGKSTRAAVFMPEVGYDCLLESKYFVLERGTERADKIVADAKVEQILGLEIGVEPMLDPTNDDVETKLSATVVPQTAAEQGTVIVPIVAGTSNLVTRAGKVLPPENFRSHDYFATEYHGMEIYGEKIAEPKAGIVVFVQIPLQF
jgi:hypothetical protein